VAEDADVIKPLDIFTKDFHVEVAPITTLDEAIDHFLKEDISLTK